MLKECHACSFLEFKGPANSNGRKRCNADAAARPASPAAGPCRFGNTTLPTSACALSLHLQAYLVVVALFLFASILTVSLSLCLSVSRSFSLSVSLSVSL